MDDKINKFSDTNISVKSNSDCVAGHQIALYTQDGQLMLQIDSQIWPLSAPHLKLHFYHDVRNRQTHFVITSPAGDFAIDYPAWWAEIPDFVAVEPEMDKDEDYLAYIYEVWQTPSLQQALIKSWTA